MEISAQQTSVRTEANQDTVINIAPDAFPSQNDLNRLGNLPFGRIAKGAVGILIIGCAAAIATMGGILPDGEVYIPNSNLSFAPSIVAGMFAGIVVGAGLIYDAAANQNI